MKKNAILLFIIFALFVGLLAFFSSQKPSRPLTKLKSDTTTPASSLTSQQRIEGSPQISTAIGMIEEVNTDQITVTNGLDSLTLKLSPNIVVTSNTANLTIHDLTKGQEVTLTLTEVGTDNFEVTQIFLKS